MFRIVCSLLMVCGLLSIDFVFAGHEHMVTESDSRTVPLNFETTLECVMNIEPDRFQWKFYPLAAKNAYNPNAPLNLNGAHFVHVPAQNYTVKRKQSDLRIQVNGKEVAGDYQCLAYYGALVVASVPWRITISHLNPFPAQGDANAVVMEGNTVNWRCVPPVANPPASIDYYYYNGAVESAAIDETYVLPTVPRLSRSLILNAVNRSQSGRYTCKATSALQDITASTTLTLSVVSAKGAPQQAPYFLIPPRKLYTVYKGEAVFLECAAIGNPLPEVVWLKRNGQLPARRISMTNGGLQIQNVSAADDGIYTCTHSNTRGKVTHQITLVYAESPTIECRLNSSSSGAIDVKQSENLDLYCAVRGVPEPQIVWFLNGYSVNDSAVEAIGNRIYFRPVEKRHAGNLQIFAVNSVKTVTKSISVKVIPLMMSSTGSGDLEMAFHRNNRIHHRHNNNNNNVQVYDTQKGRKKPPKRASKMVPPTKPTVTRLNDEAVVIRWSVPANKGLPIEFFKVQYRELGPVAAPPTHNRNHTDQTSRSRGKHSHHHHHQQSTWQTTTANIPPHIDSYEVNGLKTEHIYRFRVAAVYSNHDNRFSQNSNKFHLKRLDFDMRNPLPVPLLTHTETVNASAMRLYWTVSGNRSATTAEIDGYFINYNSASSADDYMKATVDGAEQNTYLLTHLQPDTVYDIKLQSFTSRMASEFSAILKGRTAAAPPNGGGRMKNGGGDGPPKKTGGSPPSVLVSTSTTGSTTKTTTATKDSSGTGGGGGSSVISKLYVIIAAAVLGGGALIVMVGLLFVCRRMKQKKNTTDGEDKTPSGRDDHRPHHHIQVDGLDGYRVAPKTTVMHVVNGCGPPLHSSRMTITANPLADAGNKKFLARIFSRIRTP